MRVLFGQGTLVLLPQSQTNHEIAAAFGRGWSQLENGQLLEVAEREGFDVLVSTDRDLPYQQNLSAKDIALIILSTTSWPRIQRALPQVGEAADRAATRNYVEVPIP